MATPVLQNADVRASRVVGAVVTGSRVVGAFGQSVALAAPVVKVWNALDAYAAGERVYSAGSAWSAVAAVAAAGPAPASPLWNQLTGPFSGNVQCGQFVFKATSQVAPFSMALHVPGLVAGSPVVLHSNTVLTTQILTAVPTADTLTVTIALNAAAAGDLTLSWVAPSFPAP